MNSGTTTGFEIVDLSWNIIVPNICEGRDAHRDCADFFYGIWSDQTSIAKISLAISAKTKAGGLSSEDSKWDKLPCQTYGKELKEGEAPCKDGIPESIVESLSRIGTGFKTPQLINLFKNLKIPSLAGKSKPEVPDVVELEWVGNFYYHNRYKLLPLSARPICDGLSEYNNAAVTALGGIALKLPDNFTLAFIRLLELLHLFIKLNSRELKNEIRKKLRETFQLETESFSTLLVNRSQKIIAILLLSLSDISAFEPTLRTTNSGIKRSKPKKEGQKGKITGIIGNILKRWKII